MASLTTRMDQLERNLLINGAFEIWQRGITFAGLTAAGNQYGPDRFAYRPFGGSVTSAVTLSQSTDVPTVAQSGFQSRFSAMITVTTAQLSYTGSSGIVFGYAMEGGDYLQIHGKRARLQFWVKSSVAGVYSVGLENAGSTRSYTMTYTITTASTWQLITLDFPLDTIGTWNFDNTTGLYIDFVLAMGPTRQTSVLNTWQSTDTPAASTQTNFAATVGNTFQIALAMMNPQDFTQAGASNVVVPFQRAGRTIGQELDMAKRYCELISKTGNPAYIAVGYVASSTGVGVLLNFTEKRAAPTITFSATSGFSIQTGSVNSVCTSISSSYSDTKTANLIPTGTGLTVGQVAVLIANTASIIILDAEL